MSDKLRLGLDKDDTLLDYDTPFCLWVKKTFNVSLGKDWRTKYYNGRLKVKDEWFDSFAEAGFHRSLNPILGSEYAVNALSKKYHIVVVTATPEKYFDQIRANVVGRFPVLNDVCCTHDKKLAVQKLKLDAFVDDRPEFLEGMDEFCLPICFARSWNMHYKGRRGDWMTIVEWLTQEA